MICDDSSIIDCHCCPCSVFNNKFKKELCFSETQIKFYKCINCLFPFPKFQIDSKIKLFCVSCLSEKFEECELDIEDSKLQCHICRGNVSFNSVRQHFTFIIDKFESTSGEGNEPEATRHTGANCENHLFKYKFKYGKFLMECLHCTEIRIMSDEDEIKENYDEFKICCSDTRTRYSAFCYKDCIVLSCKECLREFVLRDHISVKNWLSTGKWGCALRERPIFSLRELSVGDHLVYSRTVYEHHVIVISIDHSSNSFRQIGYTNSKTMEYKYSDASIQIKQLNFRDITEPLIVIDYLPLDVYPMSLTVKNSFGKLNETKYSLTTNNCEHMTTWCKYGRGECVQLIKWVQRYVKQGNQLLQHHTNSLMPLAVNMVGNLNRQVSGSSTLTTGVHLLARSQESAHRLLSSTIDLMPVSQRRQKASFEQEPSNSSSKRGPQ